LCGTAWPIARPCQRTWMLVRSNGSYVQLRIMWRGGSAPRWGLVVGPR